MLFQGQQFQDYLDMSLLIFVNDSFIFIVPGCGEMTGLDESVRESAYSRADQYCTVSFHRRADDVGDFPHICGIRDRTATEFKYLHINEYFLLFVFFFVRLWLWL